MQQLTKYVEVLQNSNLFIPNLARPINKMFAPLARWTLIRYKYLITACKPQILS